MISRLYECSQCRNDLDALTKQKVFELEEFKRKKIKGLDARADMKFGDMLADYGEMVKTLDAELLEQ